MPGAVELVVTLIQIAAVTAAHVISQAVVPAAIAAGTTAIVKNRKKKNDPDGEDPSKFEAWLSGTFTGWRKVVDDALSDLRGRVVKLEAAVFGRLQPTLDGVRHAVDRLDTITSLLRGDVDRLLSKVFDQLTPGLADSLASIRKLSSDLQRLTGLFDRKLADKLSALDAKVFGFFDTVERRLREHIQQAIAEATGPITRRLSELSSELRRGLGVVTGGLNGLRARLDGLFDGAGALTQRALSATLDKWGSGLFEELLGRGTGELQPHDLDYMRRPHEEEATEWAALRVSRGLDWLDLDRYLDWWRRRLVGLVPAGEPEPLPRFAPELVEPVGAISDDELKAALATTPAPPPAPAPPPPGPGFGVPIFPELHLPVGVPLPGLPLPPLRLP